MDINYLMTVLLWVIIVLFTIALLFGAFWFTYHKGQSSTEETLDKILVFRVNGQHVSRPKKGILKTKVSKGYVYKFGDKISDLCFIHKSLKSIFYRGARMVFLENRKVFAVNFDGKDNVSQSEKETLLKEFAKADIGSGAVKAVQKSQPLIFNIVLIIIALAIGAGGVLLFQSFKESSIRQQTQQTPTQQIIPAK